MNVGPKCVQQTFLTFSSKVAPQKDIPSISEYEGVPHSNEAFKVEENMDIDGTIDNPVENKNIKDKNDFQVPSINGVCDNPITETYNTKLKVNFSNSSLVHYLKCASYILFSRYLNVLINLSFGKNYFPSLNVLLKVDEIAKCVILFFWLYARF